MRIKFISLMALLLAFGSVGLAQSDGSQRLRRYAPQTQNIEQNLGQEMLTVVVDKAISTSTKQSLVSYLLQHYTSNLVSFEIDKLPGTDNLYAVTGRFSEAQNSSAEAVLLLLREQGGKVSEVNKLSDENAVYYGVIQPVFFADQNRLLVIVSMSSADGDARMDLVYEFAGNNFKPLGEIGVIEKLGESGGVWRIDSPVKRATAEYKNGNYYVTLRGKGSLHLGRKKIAPPRSPVTFFYNGKEWQQAGAKRKLSSAAQDQAQTKYDRFCRVRSYLSTARKQRHSLLLSLERAFAGKQPPFHSTELTSAT